MSLSFQNEIIGLAFVRVSLNNDNDNSLEARIILHICEMDMERKMSHETESVGFEIKIRIMCCLISKHDYSNLICGLSRFNGLQQLTSNQNLLISDCLVILLKQRLKSKNRIVNLQIDI
jgi:hypothetical protein